MVRKGEREILILLCLGAMLSLAACGQSESRAEQSPAPVSEAQADSIDAARADRIALMYDGYRKDFPEIKELEAGTLLEWIESEDLVLVDVRQEKEREISGLEDAISRAEFERRREEFEGFKVVSYCTIGYRSGRYTDVLRKNGFDAYNLVGGILAWVHAGGTIEHEGDPSRQVHVYGRQWSLLPVDYEPVW